jgi:U3 small nucleolar RNA-associated protein 20
VVLRDRADVPIKDTAIDAILSGMNIQREFEEPERRDVTYKFLKSILTSRIETAVVYDTLDNVANIMVQNSDEGIRKLARGAYVQFLLEYPQKGKRWKVQLNFLQENLGYEAEGGRLSILDVIHSLLRKASHEHVQKIADMLFIPLILVLANDGVQKCKEWAGELLKTILSKADEDLISTFLTQMRTWVGTTDNPHMVSVTLQVYRLYYEAQSVDDTDVPLLQQNILNLLKSADDQEIEWPMIYNALKLTQTLVDKFPEILLSSDSRTLWKAITKCLSYPNQWVKSSAAQLTRTYFENLAGGGIEGLPLKNAHGLELSGENINQLLRRGVHIFKTPDLEQYLADVVLPLLAYLGICAGVNGLAFRPVDKSDDEEDDCEEPAEQRTALQYLFARLSYFLRREPSQPRAPFLIPKTSALALLATLTSKLPADSIVHCLPTILLPLQHLTDKNIPTPYSTDELFRTNYNELKSNSAEILEKLQKKVGTQVFTELAVSVGQERRAKRVQRSTKRKIDAVANPERSGEQKRKKTERKKERRKEKGAEHRAQRHER